MRIFLLVALFYTVRLFSSVTLLYIETFSKTT